MVRFEPKKLVIEIDTYSPVDTWLNLHRGLCGIVRTVEHDSIRDDNFFCVIDFMEEIMPDYSEAKKMEA